MGIDCFWWEEVLSLVKTSRAAIRIQLLIGLTALQMTKKPGNSYYIILTCCNEKRREMLQALRSGCLTLQLETPMEFRSHCPPFQQESASTKGPKKLPITSNPTRGARSSVRKVAGRLARSCTALQPTLERVNKQALLLLQYHSGLGSGPIILTRFFPGARSAKSPGLSAMRLLKEPPFGLARP